MDLADVMDEIAARLDTIAELRSFAYPADALQPPAAAPVFPEEITYDQTYGRGMDRISMQWRVAVGRVSDRASRDEVAPYVAGSGASSVKTVLESGTYTSLHSLRVVDAEFDWERVAGTDYLTVRFRLDIVGSGST